MGKNQQRKTPPPFVMPSVGDVIYIPSMLHLRHGADDFHGGRCCICKVISDGNPDDPYIEVAEWPGVQVRYLPLLEDQEQLRAEFGEIVGHLCPDYRQEFNDDPYE